MFTRGYGWIFPAQSTRSHVRFNIGVGMLSADTRTRSPIQDFFDRFVEANPCCSAGTPGRRERAVGCHVGLGLPRNMVGDTRVLRVGDAANLADPLTGDGIAHALKSGRLAADAIDAASSRADDGGTLAGQADDALFSPNSIAPPATAAG